MDMYIHCTLSGSYGGAKISKKAVGPGLKEKKERGKRERMKTKLIQYSHFW